MAITLDGTNGITGSSTKAIVGTTETIIQMLAEQKFIPEFISEETYLAELPEIK